MNYYRFLNQTARFRGGSLLRMTFRDQMDESGKILMAGGMPHPNTFPVKEGSFTLTDGQTIPITPDLMKDALQYGASEGYDPLLKQLQSMTKRLHSPPCWSSSSLIVTSGSQAGLCMVMEMLISQGDYVIAEEPCYCGALAILQPYQPRYLAIEADEEGIRPDKLRAALSRWTPEQVRKATQGIPKFLYTNPNGCNPSGGVTSTERRKEIYKIASEYNFIILEDDPYYFIQFRDQKDFPPSYLSLDTEGRVMRFDSFSKTLSAGLRVGYLTGPQPLVEKVLFHQQVSVSHASVFSQIIISEILRTLGEDGFLDHTKKIKQFYEDQRNAVVAAARKHLTGLCDWWVPAGGMFLWVKVLGVADTLGMVKKALEKQKVVVVPGSGFMTDTSKPSPHIRIAFSIVTHQEMDEGLQRLAEAIKEEIESN